MIAEIHVTLKPALLDAQGKTVQRALQQLGHRGVRDVRIGKHIQIEMEEGLSNAQFQEHIETMCRQLLANPVIEDYSISIGGDIVRASTRGNSERENGRESGANIVTSDTVPSPRPQRSNAAAAPTAQPARLDAPRLSAPQPIAATVPLPQAPAQNMAPPSTLPPDVPGATPLPRESFPEASVPDAPAGNTAEGDERAAVEAR